MKIRILLADDHQMFLDGLKSILQDQPDFEVVGTATDGFSLLNLLANIATDIVLLDLNMPRMTGMEALDYIVKVHPTVRVILVSNYRRPDLVTDAINGGAAGYLLKNTPSETLLEACKSVMKGDVYFYPDKEPGIKHNQENDAHFLDPFWQRYQLTRSEIALIRLLAKSYSSKEIADIQHVSIHTIETHRRNIIHKLGVQNVAGIVAFAYENGLA